MSTFALIHGGGGTSWDWHLVSPELRERGRSARGRRRTTWGRWLRDTLPDASLRTLEGQWHGVAPQVLAPAPTEFFTPGNEV